MTAPEQLDALVELAGGFVTATWHLLDSSETSGPIDDQTIAVWKPDFDEVSALLDRCEGLPSGSTEYMTAGQLLAANMTSAITALRAEIARLTEAMHLTQEALTAEEMRGNAERQALRAEIARLTAGLSLWIDRAEVAEAEVARLREVYWRLRSYATHDDGCKLNKAPRFSGPCSCGLADALKGGAA